LERIEADRELYEIVLRATAPYFREDTPVWAEVTSLLEDLAEGRELYCHIGTGLLHEIDCAMEMEELRSLSFCRPVRLSFVNSGIRWYYSPAYLQEHGPDYLVYVDLQTTVLRRIVEGAHLLDQHVALYGSPSENVAATMDSLISIMEQGVKKYLENKDLGNLWEMERDLLGVCDFLVTPTDDGYRLFCATTDKAVSAWLQERLESFLKKS